MMTGTSNQNNGSVYAFSEMKGDGALHSNLKGAIGEATVFNNQSTDRMTDLAATHPRGGDKHESPYVAVRKFIDCTDSNVKFHGSADQSA